MGRIAYITPTNGTFTGNKIGINGNQIWFCPEQMELRFRQGLVEVDFVATDLANKPLAFYANRDIKGTLTVSGDYGAVDAHERYALNRMCKIDASEDVTIALDRGVSYTGNLIVLSDQNKWSSTGAAGEKVKFNMVFHFTGQIVGDGANESAFDGDNGSGDIYTNIKSVTNAAAQTYTRSYVDQAEDRAVQPFVVVGISEDSGVPLSVAEENVVASLGGASHNWQGISAANGGIPFSRINSRWAGMNIIVGELIYDRNVTDCKRYSYRSDIGFIVKGSEGEVITGDSGSDIDNVCADLASGPFAARFQHWRQSTVPYISHLIPCVSTTNPHANATLMGMIGKINNNAITIEGVSCPATELRFDGCKGLTKYTGPSGSKYFFYLKLDQLIGGWTDGTLTCARLEPLPLEGNQTQPGYTVVASVISLYLYDRTAFSSIAQLCSLCYS